MGTNHPASFYVLIAKDNTGVVLGLNAHPGFCAHVVLVFLGIAGIRAQSDNEAQQGGFHFFTLMG